MGNSQSLESDASSQSESDEISLPIRPALEKPGNEARSGGFVLSTPRSPNPLPPSPSSQAQRSPVAAPPPPRDFKKNSVLAAEVHSLLPAENKYIIHRMWTGTTGQSTIKNRLAIPRSLGDPIFFSDP